MQKIIFYLVYAPLRFYARRATPGRALVLLFNLHKRILTFISDRASDYNDGVHPKHRLMRYHAFFTSRLQPGERVLDIGSGRGFLSFQMARAGAKVTGIELSEKNVNISNKLYQDPNLTFIREDALAYLPDEEFDIAVMSNVLEHIENRVDFLKKVQTACRPKRWLLRVPCFDRDWIVALAQELGLDSRLDETHFIEYTDKSFRKEMENAGLSIVHFEKQWGEIWAEVKVK